MLKKLLIIALVLFVGWKYVNQSTNKPVEVQHKPVAYVKPVVKQTVPTPPKQNFTCDGRQYCSQMTSRAEAVYFIKHCPKTKMDGDHDGIPCENDSRF
ncbi:excalibur calcium-binding domain-containing protein [Neptunicella sp.]|uniref:excalibur calcium-binding domain-containing protein n=1 Tax=Neptunicella sp. TaxID=2125986 RepID=UPI003F6948DA